MFGALPCLCTSRILDTLLMCFRYVTSMYWAMSTMATVGYGDVTPIQISEKLVAMAGMLVGVTIFAYIMSTVSSLLSTFNTQNIRAQETQRQLDSFCRTHKIPPVLARKLGTYYDYVLPRQVHDADLSLIAGLSGALRQQVGTACCLWKVWTAWVRLQTDTFHMVRLLASLPMDTILYGA